MSWPCLGHGDDVLALVSVLRGDVLALSLSLGGCCLVNITATIIRTKPRNPWYTQALKKLAKRHLECIWSRTHSFEDLENLRSATNHYHATIIKAIRTYNSSLISSSSTNPRQLWKNINILLHSGCSSY